MEAFKLPARYAATGDLGVEIEVEGDNLPYLETYWNNEHDHSLRGESREYVLKKPMSVEGVKKALDYLDEMYVKCNTQVHESVRAGVHVHVNVQHLTIVELYNFMTSYIILEDILTKYCGKYREGNLFCLRVKDADYLLYTLQQVAKSKWYHTFDSDLLRYAAMNVKSLSTYGSLEFRAMRGTRDLSAIYKWASVLLNIRNEAVKFDNPKGIISWIDGYGAEAFLQRFLGDNFEELTNHLTEGKDLLEGLTRAHTLAAATDWSSFKTVDIGGVQFPLGTEFPDEPVEDF